MLEAVAVSKSFPGVRALSEVSLSVAPGETVAVVGENGAGKSTLMKILAGVQAPDEGTLRLDGKPVRFDGVRDAEHAGIAIIHQELNLAETLDVAANIYLGREPRADGLLGSIAGRILGLISRRIYDDAAAVMRRVGLDVSPRTKVAELSIGRRQLVEIAKALSFRSRYVIFDEPTSSLTEREAERLFEVIARLKADGVGILYISHRLKEIERLSDRAVVLRDGRHAGDLARGEINHNNLVRLMVGRELKQFFHRTHAPQAADVAPPVEVRDFRWSPDQAEGVSFTLRAGEVVGMAGLMGAGRTELAETLFGIRRRVTGGLFLGGREVRIDSPRRAVDAGVLLVPEDRRLQGLVIDTSIRENIGLPSLGRLQRAGLVDRRRERELAESMRERLTIRTPDVDKVVGFLSGGNQQKVVIAKWLARNPKLLILDEPTRGVDVGAKAEIYSIVDDLVRRGVAVLMISSDLEEILGVSDRVLVMHEGRLTGELARGELSEQAVMNLAVGGVASI